MALQKKNAVIYGGGSTVARAIGRLGERAFLTGHHLVSVGKGAKEIPAVSEVAGEIGAQDAQAKEAHA